ncbi:MULTISPECIES: AAA family ATPase [unclassified Agarivorans]|uniref:AAA family ATPase n=1 Tax=unclassified Agarivorans TaxID=2636026 RepID=UPI0026E33BD7|nr:MULTISPECIES: AAA family ATPase [unclassified Agarivorans]MDO6683863.1 AAA family ATPase [Agarivorans sp. 3_MG-2023]MDO6714404.1 AAA family ATPase [Agarivorans sp. 2_MG-2023]
MLEKIIKIENIKQWQHKRALSQGFDKLNLIYGRNGSGKSTLSKLFNFINENNKAAIDALKPLESDGLPALSLRVGGANVTLNSLQTPFNFQVFNQEFIDSNLYIPNAKDRSQLTNYYEFSLGKVSVLKEQDIDTLKAEIDAINIQLSPIDTRLTTKFPSKTVAKIREIKATPNANTEIASLEAQIQDLKSVEHYKSRKKLSPLTLTRPDIDISVFTLNIESLSKEAQEKVELHITNNLKERDVMWLETGTQLVNESDNCPFCAQPLANSNIFSLYQDFISESYTMASDKFELDSDQFELDVRAIGCNIEDLTALVKSNNEIIKTWSDRIKGSNPQYDFKDLDSLSTSIELECVNLINEKKKDLLLETDFTKFNQLFDSIFDGFDFSAYNSEVQEFNEQVTKFLNELATGSTQTLKAKIDSIKETQKRFETEVVDDLVNHKSLSDDKKDKTKKIKELKEEIDKDQEDSIKEHKDSINLLLKNFHSMIRVKELDKDNKGKGGSTRLKYVITFIDKELSVENVDDNKHIFERVLSIGDRSSLALAFFLSKFSKANCDNSIVVLDDPMSSLDNYRKDATIVEIEKLINNSYQTIVFSHDPFFLSEIQKHSILSQHTKCFEIDVSYKKSDPHKANSSQYISSQMIERSNYDSHVLHSYHKEYNKLYDFVADAKDESKVEIARSIRPILEAHLRFLYPREFNEGVWLGDMISMIRDETDPTSHFFDTHNRISQITKINEFSKAFHHAEGFNTKIQSLDLQTVQSYAQETLQFITGI